MKLITLIGESGAGKSTVEKLLVDEGATKVVSLTTRAMREGEVDGVDYHFVSKDAFEEYLNAGVILEYCQFNGNFYGTHKDMFPTDSDLAVIVTETTPLEQFREMFGEDCVIIYVEADLNDRLTRVGSRVASRMHDDTKTRLWRDKADGVLSNTGDLTALTESVKLLYSAILFG